MSRISGALVRRAPSVSHYSATGPSTRVEGHDVHTVHRGPDVLRAVLALDPDAVLLDIGLPELVKPADPRAIIAYLAVLKKPD